MPPLSPKWNGPVLCLTGLVMLTVQVYAYLDVGLLSSWLIGGGIGLATVGAAMWFYYVDDKRSAARTTSNDEFPSAEEYDRYFQEAEPDDTDSDNSTPNAN